MALLKDIELSTGVIAKYHRIVALQRNYDITRGYEYIITLESFLDEASKITKKPLETSQSTVPTLATLVDIYGALKLLPKYAGATDAAE